MMIFAVPIFRRRIYELFLRTHHSLAVLYFYSIWRHLPSDSVFPRLYLYVPLLILSLTTLYQLGNLLYQNSVLSSRPSPRATITCKPFDPDTTKGDKENGKEDIEKVLKICVTLGKPLAIKAGQYIQLWMPSVSFGSWMQSHPFVVTSWSPKKQDVLELFIQVRRGFTSKLHQYASISGSASFPVFVTGPFGISHSLSRYETVLAVASNFGIAGLVPYIKQLLYGYNTSTARIRRIHLVWEAKTLGTLWQI
jgi:predicted ferric reductase